MCTFLDSISIGGVKVNLSAKDLLEIQKLIGKDKAKEACEMKAKSKKITEQSIKKVEGENLGQIFKQFPLFAAWPQVLKRILLVRNILLCINFILV